MREIQSGEEYMNQEDNKHGTGAFGWLAAVFGGCIKDFFVSVSSLADVEAAVGALGRP